MEEKEKLAELQVLNLRGKEWPCLKGIEKPRMSEDLEDKGIRLVWAMVRNKDDENTLEVAGNKRQS